MPANVLLVFIGWLLALIIFFAFIIFLRYLHHKERMAMIISGIDPIRLRSPHRSGGMLRAGLITAMVGFTLTIGLYPIGFILPPIFAAIPFHLGPWLLPGLIPLGVGIALITSYYLERDAPPPDPETREAVFKVKDSVENKRHEQLSE